MNKLSERIRFEGIVKHWGSQEGPGRRYVLHTLFSPVLYADSKEVAFSKAWIKNNKAMNNLKLKIGNVIRFEARIDREKIGTFDPFLVRLTKIEIIEY